MIVIYLIIILIGFPFNVWVLSSVITILRRRNSRIPSVLVYVTALTSINLLIILSIPFTIFEFVVGYWPFPNGLCQLHWIIESLNKSMVSQIFSLLTVSCYCAVCQPQMRKIYESKFYSCVMLIIGAGIITVLSIPLVQNANVYYLAQADGNFSQIDLISRKCVYQPTIEEEIFQTTLCSFFCSYVIPIATMIFCYGSILHTVRFRSSFRKQRISRFRRVVRSVFISVCFYLASWTPYWTITLIICLREDTLNKNALQVILIAFVFHVLPYVNSACSTFIYGLLNKQIRTALQRNK